MFKTLILKEIRETFHNFRFLIATLLCLVLIPLGMYVTLKEYEQRFSDYQDSVRLYQERSEGRINSNFNAEGYRPPSVMSIFSLGLEYFLPTKVVTSPDGQFKMLDESGINNPQSLLSGKVDFLFIVSFVLSILALIFTFSSISGEKETGTLSLIMSNSVPRWKIILAKVLGNYAVFLAPFLISLLIAILIVNISGVVSVLSVKIFPSFLVILFVTLLFIFSMFNLGMLVSTLTHRSIISMITLLFVWVVLVLAVPKICPMIAEILYPVKSQQVINNEKQAIRANLESELDQKSRELFDRTMIDYGLDPSNIDKLRFAPAWNKASAQYNEDKKILEEDYQKRIVTATERIEQDYSNRRNIQDAIAKNLSRISPVSCYTYILSELSGSGVMEMTNFIEHAQRFRDQVKQDIYDNILLTRYANTFGQVIVDARLADGFNPRSVSVPHISDYQHTNLDQALKAGWVDIVLLILFNILFFTASFVSFIRYDVR